ncbi:MAG: RNA polymerase sigma-70 factor [Mediterranea sp.]|jgi:RNA polymerase sigma-70 factor (ECF subfamily)|nr:RNA polymerase sigma-70 factor [Mediterranea sp.]
MSNCKNIESAVSDIRHGCIRSFKLLFDDYYPVLCVFSSRFINDREMCKDIAQETLLSYWERRADFDSLSQVKGFLYTVVRNKCLNILRREPISVHDYYTNSIDDDFESVIIEQETYTIVRQAVNNLPMQMRRVIFYAMEGMKNKEIAEKLGVSEGTVHTLKKIAYRKLRNSLQNISMAVMMILIPLE